MEAITGVGSQAAAAGANAAALAAMCEGLARFEIDFGVEEDGRVIAEIDALPGCMVYGRSHEEAARKVQALALKIIADKIEHGEPLTYGPVANC